MTRVPLVLLPGLLCTDVLYRHQLRDLSDVADMMVADLTRDDTIADMAGRVLDEAPPTFALAGLSMGGYVAQEVLRQAPERVERLALLDTSARSDDDTQRRRREGLIAQVRRSAPEKFQGVTRRLLPLLIHPARQEDPAFVEPVQAMAKAVGQAAYVRQQTAILGRPDGRGDLGAIGCPTMVLCGREDILTPLELSEEMTQGIANARLVVIENCGHLATLEQPEAVNAAFREWLAGEAA
ncbi:MAG: alpha/beta fold hydrolase [Rhodospirillales bacterium]